MLHETGIPELIWLDDLVEISFFQGPLLELKNIFNIDLTISPKGWPTRFFQKVGI
jgi:hypothetical protein